MNKALTEWCLLQNSLVLVTYYDPTQPPLTHPGNGYQWRWNWSYPDFRFFYFSFGVLLHTRTLFFHFISLIFQGLHLSAPLEHALRPKGWTNNSNASSGNQNWENAGKLPLLPLWTALKKKIKNGCYYWLSLIFLKSRFWKEMLLCFLYKLKLNVMIMKKKSLASKCFSSEKNQV